MDRVSDEQITQLIEYFGRWRTLAASYEKDTELALTELRERREQEKQAEIDYYSNETHT